LFNEITPIMNPDIYDRAGLKKDKNKNAVLILDNKKQPIIPKDPNTGKFMLPVGPENRPIPIMDEQGRIRCCVDTDFEPILPCDNQGRPVIPLDSQGHPFCS